MENLDKYLNPENLDKDCTDTTDTDINMCVPWYLIATYSYYEDKEPLLSDTRFDRLANFMLDKWDEIEHRYKHLITVEDLKSKTFTGEYPSRISNAVSQLREAYFGKQKRS